MLFNSIEFAIFLPIVFLLYWFVFQKNLRLQNFFLLVVSYIFYGWWDWRFLSLIIISSIIDYTVGLQLSKTREQQKRKLLLWTSIIVNIGFLGFFKYFNFFVDSFVDAFSLFGKQLEVTTLKIILPVGISFYTFQTLSYTIDVYKKKLEPTNDIIAFFAFVSFFPQLVAGPIERAKNLLPQFAHRRVFIYQEAADGMRLILWGLFKKIVIADNAAIMVNEIFENYNALSSLVLITGAFYFALQIYGDFSGYSDIAIGTARLFGFKLMINFRVPYFSRDIAEFWRRWHISLSTWFRDYVYIPLGGSRVKKYKNIRNILVVFIVSGFWHGANWTFVVWGFLNAIYFLPLVLTNKNRKNLNTIAESRLLPSLKEFQQMITTFALVCLAWVFFRAENISHALSYFNKIISNPVLPNNFYFYPPYFLVLVIIFFLIEWFIFRHENSLAKVTSLPKYIREISYIVITLFILFFAPNEAQTFIYFQF